MIVISTVELELLNSLITRLGGFMIRTVREMSTISERIELHRSLFQLVERQKTNFRYVGDLFSARCRHRMASYNILDFDLQSLAGGATSQARWL